MVIFDADELMHFGILRKSGRYPWGSGDDVPQRSRTFLDTINQHKKDGWSDKQICEAYSDEESGIKMKAIDLRALTSLAKSEWKASQIAMVQRLKDAGNSPTAISRRMDIPEPTVRAYLKPGADDKNKKLYETSKMLRAEVADKTYLDVSKGTENYLNVSKERLDVSIAMLKEDGYVVHYVKQPQLGTGKDTTQKVLTAPGVTYSEVYKNRDKIQTIKQESSDYGETWYGLKPPLAVDSKRIAIAYAEDGGATKDGVIYVRPGVKDVEMGGKVYAQVRVQVGDGHYMKGMAVYKDDLPDGVDLLFHTNKTRKEAPDKLDVLKPLSDDPDNPFGAMVNQIKDDKGKVTSSMNLVNEQGDWKDWSNTIASQVLSKQSPTLAKQQLNMTMERRLNEYDEISNLTNSTVRKKLLEDFADSTDSAAVHLSAAALPRQRWHVILPVDSLKDSEVYAPNYRDGETVVLIRYPHGGTFEIPELRVNKKHSDSRRMIGDAEDAIGINSSVAQRLSGADFDGDTVLVIPNNSGAFKVSKALKELEGFDPRNSYPTYPGMKKITPDRKQQEMGNVSNLITDMTIKNASHAEIARAVRHSMVVIDAEKHQLNYKQSAIDNGITSLKEKYQGGKRKGASTLVSLAKSPIRVDERIERRAREGGPIDPATGKRQYTKTGATYINKNGQVVKRTTRTTRLAEADDAQTLSSGTPIEGIYADHSNRLKALANQARKEMVATPRAKQSPTAKQTYAKEVVSLNEKYDRALMNAPLERRAQAIAGGVLRDKKAQNPDMDPELEKKIKFQALDSARARVGAKKNLITFTQEEWDAIQAGAISDSRLSSMLDHADMKNVRELATPRTRKLMTSTRTNRAKSMLASGYTRQEVADQLGVSLTTLDESVK